MVLVAFEDQIGIVDEDHRRGVVFCPLEHLVDLVIKPGTAGDHGPIDEEEFALQAMRQGSADGRLASARRAGEKNAALRLQPELGCQAMVLKWQHDLGFERLYYVIYAFEFAQIDWCYLRDLDIACHVVLAKVTDERIGIKTLVRPLPNAGPLQLVCVERRSEAVNSGEIELAGTLRP